MHPLRNLFHSSLRFEIPMPRVVFYSSIPGMRPPRPNDSISAMLGMLAYFAAIWGAASYGWSHGGFLWAVLYGILALISFPFVLTFATVAFLALYPLLASPGSFLATQLGWTSFSPYAERRLWLQRASVLLILLPFALLLQRYPWSVLRILTGVATLGLMVVVAIICILILIVTAMYRRSVQQATSETESEPTFRWIKPDPPRLPPPEDDPPL